MQYKYKQETMIENLVETTWLDRFPWQMEIMYDQGSEFIGHEFKNYHIKGEYEMKGSPSTSGNPTSNKILERIQEY